MTDHDGLSPIFHTHPNAKQMRESPRLSVHHRLRCAYDLLKSSYCRHQKSYITTNECRLDQNRDTESTMTTSPAQSTFLSSELQRALNEQSFGIATYTLAPSASALQAIASVTLLEGRTIFITLSARGYRVRRRVRLYPSLSECRSLFLCQVGNYSTYESLDALLQAVSPMYARRRQELLIRRLEELSGR
jgi:Protein of unknown function (DUF727)